MKKVLWKLAQYGELLYHQRDSWRPSPKFMEQTAYLFSLWGYKETQFSTKTIIDIGAGSMLRSKFFKNASVIAIEPLARKFLAIPWSDLKDASKVYSLPAEEYVPELASTADFVMCINVLDHVLTPEKVISNIARYLQPSGEFCLSFDLHGKIDLMHVSFMHLDDTLQWLVESDLIVIRTMAGLGEIGKCYRDGEAITIIARKKILSLES